MAKAAWKDIVLAERNTSEVVAGNLYFSTEALQREHFKESNRKSNCPWTGGPVTIRSRLMEMRSPTRHGTIPALKRLLRISSGISSFGTGLRFPDKW